jgi:hypothetical protein
MISSYRVDRLRPRSLGNKMPMTSHRPILTLRLPLHKLTQLTRQRDRHLLGFHQQSSIVEENESFAAISNAPHVPAMTAAGLCLATQEVVADSRGVYAA